MTNLNEVFGVNQYCGPGVLSALTGLSTDRCAAVISAVTGRNVIKGTQIPHLLEAAKRLGFESSEVKPLASTVYGQICQLVNQDGYYIISVPSHVIAMEIRDKAVYLIDNQTKQPVSAQSSARLLLRVMGVYKLKGKTAEQKAEEARQARIKWLKEQISSLNNQIEMRLKHIDTYQEELNQLCSGDQPHKA